MNTPVVFFVFNRPECTCLTLDAIRKVKPRKLFVVADGPRINRKGEANLCEATRQIVDEGIDWPCDVQRNYTAFNLGCGNRVSSGLDWVFREVEEAIILEDDTVPRPSFFSFCDDLLSKFRKNPRVFAVCGDSVFHTRKRTRPSYRFSNFFSPWGWATWRSKWDHYDYKMKFWTELRESRALASIIPEPEWRERWIFLMDETANGNIDTWDYQWISTIWNHCGMVVHPNRNLIRNIGAGADASHTFSLGNPRTYRKTYCMPQILDHPACISIDERADRMVRQAYMEIPSFYEKATAGVRHLMARCFGI